MSIKIVFKQIGIIFVLLFKWTFIGAMVAIGFIVVVWTMAIVSNMLFGVKIVTDYFAGVTVAGALFGSILGIILGVIHVILKIFEIKHGVTITIALLSGVGCSSLICSLASISDGPLSQAHRMGWTPPTIGLLVGAIIGATLNKVIVGLMGKIKNFH